MWSWRKPRRCPSDFLTRTTYSNYPCATFKVKESTTTKHCCLNSVASMTPEWVLHVETRSASLVWGIWLTARATLDTSNLQDQYIMWASSMQSVKFWKLFVSIVADLWYIVRQRGNRLQKLLTLNSDFTEFWPLLRKHLRESVIWKMEDVALFSQNLPKKLYLLWFNDLTTYRKRRISR